MVEGSRLIWCYDFFWLQTLMAADNKKAYEVVARGGSGVMFCNPSMFLTFLEVASRCILWKMEEKKHVEKEEGNTQQDPKLLMRL
ncbi:hypothetical protein L1887_32688 [Cichorium endivia]|nr:hypothetical protein L1887_32688 [Cichorium endivia]